MQFTKDMLLSCAWHDVVTLWQPWILELRNPFTFFIPY